MELYEMELVLCEWGFLVPAVKVPIVRDGKAHKMSFLRAWGGI